MKKLLLLSKFFTQGAQDFVKKVLNKKPNQIRIAFCADAALPNTDVDYVNDSRNELLSKGFYVKDFTLNDYINSPTEFTNFLSGFDATYFAGGSALGLNNLFNKSGLVEVYKELVNSGKIMHIGSSAGGMICSKDMKYAQIIDADDKLKEVVFEGLNLVDIYYAPHVGDKEKYTLRYNDAAKRFPKDKDIFIPLNNQQGIVVEDNKWEVI